MDGGETFGTNFYKYRNHYFRQNGYYRFAKWVLKNGAIEDISRRMYKKAIRYTLEECIDMPEKTYQTISLPMDEIQASLYRDVAEKILIEVKNEGMVDSNGRVLVKATEIITKLVKLAQVCSGFLYTEGMTKVLKENPKLDALNNLLEDILPNAKVIVWCRFIESIKLLEANLKEKGYKVLTYYGVHSAKEKSDIVNKLQNDPEHKILIGQVRSGVGANLTAATYAIYYENEWSTDARVQSEHRIYRTGQFNKTVIIDLVMKGTVEERIMKALKGNIKISLAILGDSLSTFMGV